LHRYALQVIIKQSGAAPDPVQKELLKMNYSVLIPAYQPDEKLYDLAKTLSEMKIPAVIVNDGSTEGLEVFESCRGLSGVTVLGYAENHGKGYALKTGIRYLKEQGFDCAVTADADGQHLPKDIIRIAASSSENPAALIMGMRDVSLMPPRSKTGNSLTRTLFKLLYNIDLQDTQTGLRGIPLRDDNIQGLLGIVGNRYEYEMDMLVESARLFPGGIIEVPIETVYIDNNASTHFHAIRDGSKVYKVLFRRFPKFLIASASSFGVDYLLFNALYYLLFRKVGPATVCARAVSAVYNYIVNKKLVFKDSGSKYNPVSYAVLAVAVLCANIALMKLLVDLLHWPAFLAKILVEVVLYIVNFFIQQNLASRK